MCNSLHNLLIILLHNSIISKNFLIASDPSHFFRGKGRLKSRGRREGKRVITGKYNWVKTRYPGATKHRDILYQIPIFYFQ